MMNLHLLHLLCPRQAQTTPQQNAKKVNDPDWEKGLGSAIDKLVGSIIKARSGGGLKPRGSGRQMFAEFDCDKKTYRVDIDIHGDGNVDFFT